MTSHFHPILFEYIMWCMEWTGMVALPKRRHNPLQKHVRSEYMKSIFHWLPPKMKKKKVGKMTVLVYVERRTLHIKLLESTQQM